MELDNKKESRFFMDEQDVLRHLLDVESRASVLVDDAQAEADRRIAESEKQYRARYDEEYGREAAELESRYEGDLGAVKEHYKQQLDAYRNSLAAIPVYRGDFASRVEKLLLREC
jgi:ethanolamine utilization cobalamin adenosyltransferase